MPCDFCPVHDLGAILRDEETSAGRSPNTESMVFSGVAKCVRLTNAFVHTET